MNKLKYIPALLLGNVALPLVSQAQSTCGAAFRDTLSVRTLAAFERAAVVPAVWDNYEFRRHPLLLLADSAYHGDSATPVCAGIWRAGTALEIVELPARPPFSTPLYGMIDSDPVGPRAIESASDLVRVSGLAAPGVLSALRDRGVTRAVVLNVPMSFGGMGRLGEMLIATKADPARIQADLAVHESFHLHSQFPRWLDQTGTYAWPAWDVQPDRAELRQRCYAGSPELSAALRRELDALVAAYDALILDSAARDIDVALRHAQRAIALRADRRRLQDTMTVAQGHGRIPCGVAEDLMELEEGATLWVGNATVRNAGLISAVTLRGSYNGSQPEVFYQTGPLQLWVLDGLVGREALRRITGAMVRAPTIESGSVHAQFKREVRRLVPHR